jgi:hypothetical protein
MLKNYYFGCELFLAGTSGIIALAARLRKLDRWGNLTETRNTANRHPTTPTLPTRSEDIIGRLTYAALTSFPNHDRKTVRAMVRRWLTATERTKPAKELPETNVAFDTRGKRISLKIGRWLSRHVNPTLATKLTDRQIETIANRFPMQRNCTCRLEIVSGADACDVYERGDISSCMTGGSDRDKHEATFIGNEDRLKLVVGNGGKALRAKIWKHDTEGTWTVDRIYSTADTGFAYEESALLADAVARWLADNGHPVHAGDYCTTLKHAAGDPLPYCDRVYKFSRLSDSRLKFHSAGKHDGQHTDGTDESCPSCVCSCCDCHIDEDDAYHHDGETYCDSCYSDRFTYCDETDQDEPCDDVTYDEVTERSILDRNSVRLRDGRTTHEDDATELDRDLYGRNEYALTDETCETENGETILCEDAIYDDDGDRCWHCSTTLVETEDAGQQPEDDCTEDDDGLWWLDIGNRPDIVSDLDDRTPLTGQLELPLGE